MTVRAGSAPRVRGTPYHDQGVWLKMRFSPACAGNAPGLSRRRSRTPVQPRVCGERFTATGSMTSFAGSAPRVRGTPHYRAFMPHPVRFSPACAGNAQQLHAYIEYMSVQPRVCGERLLAGSHTLKQFGSAPRVRGTPAGRIAHAEAVRFSPACAGNATPPTGSVCGAPVQPRVCGERAVFCASRSATVGSAPRVRGTLSQFQSTLSLSRFSPACAGNASSQLRRTRAIAVQPRVCGECSDIARAEQIEDGSAPRVRGTQDGAPERHPLRRFSPACAGNANNPLAAAHSWPVQPRVCGERTGTGILGLTTGGSAPRVRGTLCSARCCCLPYRFSPACAGNAAVESALAIAISVQPRVCGERTGTGILGLTTGGSAPRVRGTLCSARCCCLPYRFSPACAGNAAVESALAIAISVQPRVCGERRCQVPGVARYTGSAPRVRGTPQGERRGE